MKVRYIVESEGTSAHVVGRNLPISECAYVVTPDGRLIDMKRLKRFVNIAVATVDKSIDTTLQQFFNILPISYTFAIPTMATNGKNILINPGFAQKLLDTFGGKNPVGIAFVLLHELLHVVFDHTTDIYNKDYPDHDKANRAQDYEINYMIENSTFDANNETGGLDYIFNGFTKQLNGLIDEKYAGKVWMEIYKELDSEKREEPDEQEMSDDMKRGIQDGINEALGNSSSDDDSSDSDEGNNNSQNGEGDGGDEKQSGNGNSNDGESEGGENGDDNANGAEGNGSNNPQGDGEGDGGEGNGESENGGQQGNNSGNSSSGGNGSQQSNGTMGSVGGSSQSQSGSNSDDYERGKEIGKELAKAIKEGKVGIADGKFTGNNSINCGEHTITDEEAQKIMDGAGIEPNGEPIKTSELVDSIENIFKRPMMERTGNGEEHAGKIIEKIKQARRGFKNWKQVLREFLIEKTREYVGWNKKMLSTQRIPLRRKDSMPTSANRLVICVDTSGSVCGTPGMLQQVCTEISNIAQTCNIENIDLIQFDDGPYSPEKGKSPIQELKPYKMPADWSIKNISGGGTEFLPVYELLYKTYTKGHRDYNAILFITDTDMCSYMNTTDAFKEKHGVEPFVGRKGLYMVFNNSFSNYDDEAKNSIQKTSKLLMISRDAFLRQANITLEESVNEAFVDIEDDDENVPEIDLHTSTEEEIEKTKLSAAKIAGTFENYAEDIIKWMSLNYRKLSYVKGSFELNQTRNSYLIDTDMKMIVNCPMFDANRLQYAPEYIRIINVIGDVYLTKSLIRNFNDAFPKRCSGNVHIMDCPNLVSLKGCPVPGKGKVYLSGRTKINKQEEIEDFNEKNVKIITESMKNIDAYKELVAKRIKLGKLYESQLDEAFGYYYDRNGERHVSHKNPLNKIMRNPESREIFNTELSKLRDWGYVDDSIVTEINMDDPTAVKTLNDAASVDKESSEKDTVADIIFTDDNYKITAFLSGRRKRDGGMYTWKFDYLDDNIDELTMPRVRGARKFKEDLKNLNISTNEIPAGSFNKEESYSTLKTPTLQSFLGKILFEYLKGYEVHENLINDEYKGERSDIFIELKDEGEQKGLDINQSYQHGSQMCDFGYGAFGCAWSHGRQGRDTANPYTKNFLMSVAPEKDGKPQTDMYLSIAQFFIPEFIESLLSAVFCDNEDDVKEISEMDAYELIRVFNEHADIDLNDTILTGLSGIAQENNPKRKPLEHITLKELIARGFDKNHFDMFDEFIHLFPDYCSFAFVIGGENPEDISGEWSGSENGVKLGDEFEKTSLSRGTIRKLSNDYGVTYEDMPKTIGEHDYNEFIKNGVSKAAMDLIYGRIEVKRPFTKQELRDKDTTELFVNRSAKSEYERRNAGYRHNSAEKYKEYLDAARKRLHDEGDAEKRIEALQNYKEILRKFRAGNASEEELAAAKDTLKGIIAFRRGLDFSATLAELKKLLVSILTQPAKLNRAQLAQVNDGISAIELLSTNAKDVYGDEKLEEMPDKIQELYERFVEALNTIKSSRPQSEAAINALDDIKSITEEIVSENNTMRSIIRQNKTTRYKDIKNKTNLDGVVKDVVKMNRLAKMNAGKLSAEDFSNFKKVMTDAANAYSFIGSLPTVEYFIKSIQGNKNSLDGLLPVLKSASQIDGNAVPVKEVYDAFVRFAQVLDDKANALNAAKEKLSAETAA